MRERRLVIADMAMHVQALVPPSSEKVYCDTSRTVTRSPAALALAGGGGGGRPPPSSRSSACVVSPEHASKALAAAVASKPIASKFSIANFQFLDQRLFDGRRHLKATGYTNKVLSFWKRLVPKTFVLFVGELARIDTVSL